MRIPLDPQKETPLYLQIEAFLRNAIQTGILAPETRLPATRQLAEDLGLSRITVENAYAVLEADGFVERRAGSGTYVLPPPVNNLTRATQQGEWPLWQREAFENSPFVYHEERSSIRHPDPIAFTGFGDPQRFPVDEFLRAIKEVIRRDGLDSFAFEDIRGYAPLRSTIAQILANQGVRGDPEHVLITSGSQQALTLIAQILLKPGDTVLVEKPSYDGALDLFRAHRAKLVACPVDESGMQIEQLEPLLQQHHPKLIYTIPTFQNPTGMSMSTARRRELVRLAECYNAALVEDDFAAELRYEGRTLPALKAFDQRGQVIYIGSFSKLLMPGLRIGFLMAEGPIYRQLVHFKRVNDLMTSTLSQRALEHYVTVGRYEAHVRRSSQAYRKRRDLLAKAIDELLPAECSYSLPQGGLFLWLRLPEGVSAQALQQHAAQEGVHFAVGSRFFIQPEHGDSFLRLNFAAVPQDRIYEGVRRLQRALGRMG
jgi:Transcriptional regulators containing a DNA-binding HTH domain and an aminotransferase domain (MocR family) and their eukaryotic orthologs